MPYDGLRDYLSALESHGLLQWVEKEVDKDWEISSLARQYFRKTDSKNRTAIGFRHVKGSDIPVVLGIIGGSRKIYGLALETELIAEEFFQTWKQGFEIPLEPLMVNLGPCKEIILKGKEIDLNRFPIPVWTPGKDPNPYLTAACSITKDLETGIRNVGVYRMEVKGKDHTGILWDPSGE